MATSVLIKDDLTGDVIPEEIPPTRIYVEDSRENVSIELDLTDVNLKDLIHKALAKYVKAGRPIAATTAERKSNDPSEAAKARAWALAQPAEAGLKVAERGMVSKAVIEAYRAAQS